MLQGALKYLADCSDAKTKEILTATIRLHMMLLVKQNLVWYILNGCISEQAAANLDDEFD